ncbi:glycoside hydrolase family 72 protein [Trichoderma virens Gv29-8]|uniref:1,3-beta-glucanosyltransferase n=1 Tax=Hypocrea virens (strain Gv29-8 / FGSC 10586) TaxID=413071 RepID=G9N0W8_HYPVG|nr:glycoside hydrolase family 72 protein [Trichoderma virens Gv29-8]EHK19401.1 glycoside hydrolase family 72 protein [Trichoderma virens Gv29-8]
MGIYSISLSFLLFACVVLSDDLPSIQIKGSKFFYANGTQFFLKGIAYQQDSSANGAIATNTKFVDPLADEANCKRDIPLLSELGTNVIRTYAIDPTADHSACMSLLNDAGIYVISDLSNPQQSIDRGNPQWNVDLFTHFQQVVDSFANYSNVIGFFVGNEVTNNASTTSASAYVKAAVRDVKQYIKDKKYRAMGVGYAADDDQDIRNQIAAYFNCGPTEESVDFFGYNVYEWCGEKTFETSGYNRILDFFQNYSVPVFFAEYGCNLPNGAAGRIFQETGALYAHNMTAVLSGGIVYEYFEETNDYGLVKISGSSATKLEDFTALQQQIQAVNIQGVEMANYNPSNQPASCPTVNSTWESSDKLPPTPDSDACSCMVKASECVVSSSTDSSNYGSLFDYVCGSDQSLCSGINGDTSTGVYGPYSMCSDQDKLTYVLNQYYQKQKKVSTACDFNSSAETQTASGSLDKCSQLATSGNATDSGNATGSGSDDEDNGSADSLIPGNWPLGAVMLITILVSTGVVGL